MPLDHYVSQVHLRRFISPALGNRLHAIRKADLFYFTPTPQDVCRIANNSTNRYLPEERVIEDFLKTIEPRYNDAADNLRGGKISEESIYVVSGFLAYILTCSPAAMRHQQTPIREMLEMATQAYDRRGLLPRAPPELNSATVSNLIASGEIKIEIDQKYPQALGISSVIELIGSYGNGSWEVLVNEHEDSPFFTSDFPVATLPADPGIAHRVLPITPQMAVKILPLKVPAGSEPDLSFSRNRTIRRNISRREAVGINRSLVQAAESEVYFRDAQEWVKRFVGRHADYRTEVRAERIPHCRGEILHTKTRIVKWKK